MTIAAPQKDPTKVIPPEVLRRWEDMVRRAVAANQPVGPMVQQFAEQAFNRRVAHLNTQATRRRDLQALRRVVAQELETAQGFLQGVDKQKSDVLPKPYQGYVFELKQRAEKPSKNAARLSSTPIARASEDHAHKSAPIESLFTQRPQLQKYAETLKAQIAALDHEQSTLDAAVLRGMENRESLVSELTQMAWALYKVAEGIIATMQPARVQEFLPENTMSEFRAKPPVPMGADEATVTATTTMAATTTVTATSPSPRPKDEKLVQALTQSAEMANVAQLHSAIFTLATDATRQFVERQMSALPLSKVQGTMAATGTVIGKVLTVGFGHAGLMANYAKGMVVNAWRDVLRRVFKVLVKPHIT